MSRRPPLAVRIKKSARERERYWTDESYRLRQINKARRQKGARPCEHISDIATSGPRV